MNEYRPDMTFDEVFTDWRDCNPRVKSKETVRLMQSSCRRFVEFIGRAVLLSDLTEKNLTAFIHHRQALGKSGRTVEREANKIATLWRWAAMRGWCKTPMVSFSKMPPPTPTAWSRQELHRLFKAADEYDVQIFLNRHRGVTDRYETADSIRGGIVYGAVVRVLFETGERINAALELTWADVDLAGRWITFRGETRKGRSKAADNVQRISRRTQRAVRELHSALAERGKAEPAARCFLNYSRYTWYHHMHKILRAAGLPEDRRSMFHRLRRTHATHLYVVGGDATQSLGHASDQMTRDYYLDPRYTRKDYAADLLSGGILEPFRRLGRKLKAAFGLW